MSYVAGRSAKGLERELGVSNIVKLGSNENPLGPSPAAVRALHEASASMHRYPGVEEDDLRADIAAAVGLPVENVAIDCGSCGMLLASAAAVLEPGSRAVISRPYFKMYELCALRARAEIDWVDPVEYAYDIDAMAAAVRPGTRIVYVTNPNNPTGLAVSSAEMTRLLAAVPDSVLVVMDEAYMEFVEMLDFPDSVAAVRAGRNVLVLRTFSKVYGLAGLRVGYGIGPEPLIEQIRSLQPPFHVGLQALVAARAAFADTEFVDRSRAHNASGRAELARALTALGVRVLPSQANHVLIVGLEDVETIERALLRRGVIVRPTEASFGLPGCIRVTVGLESDNAAFVRAFGEILSDSRLDCSG
ncbi:MAG: histidinol-phosphate transaminase [Gaiellales bacterium]